MKAPIRGATEMTLTEIYTKEYLEKIFYYCLKKTHSEEDANELAADISCEIITAFKLRPEPKNLDSWIWKVASNRYKRWAKQKWFSPEQVDIDDIYDSIPDNESVEDAAVLSESMALMRRELAFIRSDYRNILVAHYFEEKSVSVIAKEFNLPIGTVKTKLQNSRKKLKEGMNMAREFGKRSYKPENVNFVMSGRNGDNGQPWSLVTHLLCKNIFLEAYENPQTAEELSLELGIALPYMEDELERLTREELMRKYDNGKYETNFKIISREEQLKEFETCKKIQKPLTDKLCTLIDTYMEKDGAKVDMNNIGYEAAKWALLVKTFDWFDMSYFGDKFSKSYPKRPDNGQWELTGFETPDFAQPYFVGQHGCMIDTNDKTQNLDIHFSQYKFHYMSMGNRTPLFLKYNEALTLYNVVMNNIDKCEDVYIEKLLEYGYLRKDGEKIVPNLVVFDREAANNRGEETSKVLSTLKDEVISIMRDAPMISRGYVVEQALNDGWLKYSDDLILSAGAYIYKQIEHIS